MPSGKRITVNMSSAPVVVAASSASPNGATMYASVNPMTDCVARASTTGHASVSSTRSVGATGGCAVAEESSMGANPEAIALGVNGGADWLGVASRTAPT